MNSLSLKQVSRFFAHSGATVPVICGAMYPCSNPELIAAVSEAGGLGVIQPISLTYVYGYEFRIGLKKIKSLTSKPLAMNALVEKSSKIYERKMSMWVDIALQEGIRFFVTSLGNPRWVVDRVHQCGGKVYHDVTEKKWALKGLEAGVDGLIAVNNRAGGHAGHKSTEQLYAELEKFDVPLICAGGISREGEFLAALQMGYSGVQMGTRFIATNECGASDAYKQAIVAANEQDIVLTERVTGVPVSVIRTPYIQRMGLKAGMIARWLLKRRTGKHFMRMLYALKSLYQLKRASLANSKGQQYWQAGKSVDGIAQIESAGKIVQRLAAALESQAQDKAN